MACASRERRSSRALQKPRGSAQVYEQSPPPPVGLRKIRRVCNSSTYDMKHVFSSAPRSWGDVLTVLALLLSWGSQSTRGQDANCPQQTFERTSRTRTLSTYTESQDCRERCLRDARCVAFLQHRSDAGRCALVTSHSTKVQPDPDWDLYTKMCLPQGCRQLHWVVERILSWELPAEFMEPTTLEFSNREECARACLTEPRFNCRSARYDGRRCQLSRHDRRTESLRLGTSSVEYLENLCMDDPGSCLFHKKVVPSGLLWFNKLPQVVNTPEGCQEACSAHSAFPCRTYVFDPGSLECRLSPDDSTTPSTEEEQLGDLLEVLEKSSCIDVTMECEGAAMTAVVKVSLPFRGRVYSAGHPYDCYAVAVAPDGRVALTMPLRSSSCGTSSLGNGTFVNHVIIQHHPFVLRSSDRRVSVACDYEEVRRKLRGGKHVTEGESPRYTQTVTGLAPTPPVRLRVVDEQDRDVTGAELGDPLYLLVELADDSVFGIQANSLLARTSQGTENVLLLDDDGCPLEPSVFPGFTARSKSLVAPFQAFKFASESTVKFQVTVSFCLDRCPPSCSRGGRGRRAVQGVVSDVTMETAFFVVSNLRMSELGPESHLAVGARSDYSNPSHQICVSSFLMYALSGLVALLQLVIIGACAFFCVSNQKQTKRSRPSSVSSKLGLYRPSSTVPNSHRSVITE